MADVIDVVHRITYDVRDAELIRATETIKIQIERFIQLNELLLRTQKRMDAIGSGDSGYKRLEELTDRLTDRINHQAKSISSVIEKNGKWQSAITAVTGASSKFINIAGGIASGINAALQFIDMVQSAIDKLDELTKVYAEHEQANRSLQVSLQDFGKETYFEDLTKQAEDLSEQLGYLDETDIEKVQTALVQFGQLGGEEIKKLTGVIVDYAARQHVSIEESAQVFINALNGQTDAFRKLNINIKSGGTVAENYQQIITTVFRNVEGSAQQFATTTEGNVEKLKQMFAEFKEKIGEGIAGVLFGPVEKMKSQQEILETTRIEFNAEADALKNANLPMEVRKQLIDDINTKYAAYLPQLLTEKSTLQDIEKAQTAVNDALLQEILYRTYNDERGALLKKKFEGVKILTERSVDSAKYAKQGTLGYYNLDERYGESPDVVQRLAGQHNTMQEISAYLGNKKMADADNGLKELDALYAELAKDLGTTLEAIKKRFEKIFSSSNTGGGTSTRSRTGTVSTHRKLPKKEAIQPLQPINSIKELPVNIEQPVFQTVDADAILKEAQEKQRLEQEAKDKAAQERRREQIKKSIDAYQQLADAATQAFQTIYEAQIKALDKEIAIRQKRVDEAMKLAERGNTEVLRQEEERLKETQKKREQYARREQVVNAAVTISNAIVAIAKAAAEGAGQGGYGAIATVAATIAALAAGYAAVQSLSNNSESFKDGVVDYRGAGGPRDDANWVRISSGESVITAGGTKANRHLLEAINNGTQFRVLDPALAYTMPAFRQPQQLQQGAYASAQDMQTLERKLDDVVSAIEDNRMKQDIFFNEHGVGLLTERAIRKNNRRFR